MDDKVSIPKFNGSDFGVWKAQIEAYIIAKNWHFVLSQVKSEVELTRQASFDGIDRHVKALLLMSLDTKNARLVLKCGSAREIWHRLIAIHEQKSNTNKLVLQKKFFDLRMAADEKVQEYVARAEYISGQLEDTDAKISESTLVAKIVSGLADKFQSFVTCWMNVSSEDQTVDNLLPKLMAEEQMREESDVPESVALASQSNNKRREFNESGRFKKRERPYKRDMSNVKCYNCQGKGHFARQCRRPKSKREKGDVDHSDDQGEKGNSVAVVAEVNSSTNSDDWILDSGATQHMTYSRASFMRYKELKTPQKVNFAGNEHGFCLGIGDIAAKSLIDGKEQSLTIKDVMYVPQIRRKLLSVSSVIARGNIGEVIGDKFIIRSQKGAKLMIGSKCGNLYRVSLKESCSSACVASTDDIALWHERFGHLNKRTILDMFVKKAVIGCDALPRPRSRDNRSRIDCEACCLGKQARRAFTNSTRERATAVGQRVHVDMCGPMGTATLEGSRYFVLAKDEYSTYRLAYFTKTKDQFHDCVRKVIAQIEGDTGKRVSKLISDRGSELMSRKTQDYLVEMKIAHETSAPFTPEQNGLIERDNRTVVEMARSMLFHRKLSEVLWGEAVNTAVYLLNRSSSKLTGASTPYERYYGSRPRISHLRVFGSFAMLKEQHKKRSGYQGKLEPRARSVILVGYDRDYTYRVFDPVTKQVIISRDVSIDETRGLDPEGSRDYKHLEACIDSLPVVLSNGEHSDAESDNESFESSREAPINGESFQREQQDETQGEHEEIVAVDSESHEPEQPQVSDTQRYNLRRRNEGPNYVCTAEALLSYDGEPLNYHEAISCEDAREWKAAMEDEYNSLMKNQTWDIVECPPDRKPIKCMWVYKLKKRTDGSVDRFKARLVAKGCSQKAGIDYSETFSPVARLDSIRLLLAIAAHEDLELLHFDVKTAFLHGSLTETIYMDQPLGFEKEKGKVCRLRRSLYGLKQASRAWNQCFIEFLKIFDLQPLIKDSCILVRKNTSDTLILCIYVDDGLVCCSCKKLLKQVVYHLKSRFEITVMDPTCFVGLQIRRDRKRKKLWISQECYIKRIVERFGLIDAKTHSTPMLRDQKLCISGVYGNEEEEAIDEPYREAIGSLMYAALGSRPDIAFAVGYLSRFASSPKKAHWTAVRRIFKYLKGTADYALTFSGSDATRGSKLLCYVDSDFAGDLDSRKSTAGYMILFNEAPVVWKSCKQAKVTTSTTEAEFVASAMACSEVLGLRQLLSELQRKERQPTKLFIDNQGAVKLIKNGQIRSKIRHLDVAYMFIRESQSSGDIETVYIETENQLADTLTKPLPFERFAKLRERIGLRKAQC